MQSPKTILLIDDDSDDQEIFSNALKKTGTSLKCVFANDGIDALEKLNAEASFIPDLIFIDLNMPRMNGQDCLVNIKKIERLKNVPVFMYSTTADPKAIEVNKKSGATDFIVKPSSIHDLTNVLSNLIKQYSFLFGFLAVFIVGIPSQLLAQKTTHAVSRLKKLSVEELMNVEVTSVSRTPQKLSEVASAIQVLTSEDIKRSPTTLMPEVLRLAPNLQVARSGAHDWGITARGFNGAPVASSTLADKLLVTVDGRAVYNPLFGGVYWDVQGVLKDDIDRIEVVSGPGGTLWGANAVNGVINIISKSAKETQGFSGGVSYGTFLKDGFSLKYGSHIDSNFYFRIYGSGFQFNSTSFSNDSTANDKWGMLRGGFRMDYVPAGKNSMTLQGDLYTGKENVPSNTNTIVNGGNILGRWTHDFSERSNLNFQAYYDRTWRNIKEQSLTDEINTIDFDLQYGHSIGNRNRVLVGATYRSQDDNTTDSAFTFTPARKTLELFSGFVQDQLTLIPKRLEFTIGTKLLHNVYTHFEWQPSARLAYTPTDRSTIWTAVSRAVRTPSRFDVDLSSFRRIERSEFQSENVRAYEMGYRLRPQTNLSFSLAIFYNQYTDLRSINATGDPQVPYIFANSLKANTWGLEFSGNAVISKAWRLRGGVTYLDKDFTSTSNNLFPDNDKFEAIDPKFQAMLQSILDLPRHIEFDLLTRYVSQLYGSKTVGVADVPAYLSLDVRLGWSFKNLNFSVSAQNITDARHAEFGSREIPRSIHGKIGFNF